MNTEAINKHGILARIGKTILFAFISIFMFLVLIRILIPKWNYPKMAENASYSISSFYAQEENVDEVIFAGTSHTLMAVSPMNIYRDYGIVSYNIGTSGQAIGDTYVLVKHALETQKPKVIVLDVSGLFFFHDVDEYSWAWEYITTSIPFLRKKAEAISDRNDLLNRIRDGDYKTGCIWKEIIPLERYHARWKELTWEDLRDFVPEREYYTAGFFLSPAVIPCDGTVEEMNVVAEEMQLNVVSRKTIMQEGEIRSEEHEEPLYSIQIPHNNQLILDEISKLCKAYGTDLLLVKYPSVRRPDNYASAWTVMRSRYMKEFAKEYGYDFIDLLYDVDLSIDTEHDFIDGGMHLNYNGARKISSFLGDYLMDHYEIEPDGNDGFGSNMKIFDRISDIADIEMEWDLPSYVKRLSENKDQLIVCMSAADNWMDGLTGCYGVLSELGIKSCIIDSIHAGDSFAAIIDGGNVILEGSANRRLETDKKDIDDKTISIVSSGGYNGLQASVMIDDRDYSINRPGLNIVVVDKSTGLVVDSAVCYINNQSSKIEHGSSLKYMNEYLANIK